MAKGHLWGFPETQYGHSRLKLEEVLQNLPGPKILLDDYRRTTTVRNISDYLTDSDELVRVQGDDFVPLESDDIEKEYVEAVDDLYDLPLKQFRNPRRTSTARSTRRTLFALSIGLFERPPRNTVLFYASYRVGPMILGFSGSTTAT